MPKRAFEYTREVTAFGPRYMGSENHKKLERYIVDHLKGDQVEDDAFTADTAEGKFPVRNIIAKFPGTKDGIIVIVGHYDTNYPLRNTGYVGANDGGSSTAILLEFANQLRGKKRDGYSVWLVWTDGEEAVQKWTDTDSVYGARHLAEKWEKDGTLKKIKALMVMDMIGDADLNIDRNTNGAPWLIDLIYAAAEREGYQSHFYAREGANRRRSPALSQTWSAYCRCHRPRLRLQQRLPPHTAGHHGQAQPEEPGDRRRHHPRDSPHARSAVT